jgi:hypothetical protein
MMGQSKMLIIQKKQKTFGCTLRSNYYKTPYKVTVVEW